MNTFTSFETCNARRNRFTTTIVIASMLIALVAPDLAYATAAGGTDRIVTGVDNVVVLCGLIGLGIITIAWSFAGWKMATAGANFRDMSGPFIGGLIAGAAAPLAAWIFTG